MKADAGLREGDRIYSLLRKRILTLDLAPGAVLDEANIVQDMGTSRTPVREATIRLVSEGLLHRDGRQIVVPTFQVGQLRSFFEALTLLSRVTHRLAAERRSTEQLRQIRQAADAFEARTFSGSELDMTDANHLFHKTIASACDNQFFIESYDTILIQSLKLSRHCFVAGKRSEYRHREHLDQIVEEHRQLTEAITNMDTDRADTMAAAHIDLFRSWLSAQLLGDVETLAELAL